VWTNSLLSIASTGCGLICVGAGEEQVQKIYTCVASRCGETSRLGSNELVADGIKCGPHGGKKGKTKSCTVL
jgi:hypothetical protein